MPATTAAAAAHPRNRRSQQGRRCSRPAYDRSAGTNPTAMRHGTAAGASPDVRQPVAVGFVLVAGFPAAAPGRVPPLSRVRCQSRLVHPLAPFRHLAEPFRSPSIAVVPVVFRIGGRLLAQRRRGRDVLARTAVTPTSLPQRLISVVSVTVLGAGIDGPRFRRQPHRCRRG